MRPAPLVQIAQFIAVCSASILVETLGSAASFASLWRGKRRVCERCKPLLTDQLQPSTNADKLSDTARAVWRSLSLAPTSLGIYASSGISSRACCSALRFSRSNSIVLVCVAATDWLRISSSRLLPQRPMNVTNRVESAVQITVTIWTFYSMGPVSVTSWSSSFLSVMDAWRAQAPRPGCLTHEWRACRSLTLACCGGRTRGSTRPTGPAASDRPRA